MSERLRQNVIDLPNQRTFVIGNNALKAEYWEQPKPIPGQIIESEQYIKNPLSKEIEHFDKNYRQEGLPRDWYRVDDIGFSSKRQMRLLKEGGDVNKWAEQTGQDLLGFGLEYLMQGTVFPFEYQIEQGELVDKKYGGRRMVDTVDPKERDGAVLESLQRIQMHLLKGAENSTAIMVSPPGNTGLTMDDGSSIFYTDTMVFHMQKKGNKVVGTTIRTDINLPQARELIKKLSGKEITQNLTATDCTRAITLLDGNYSKNIYELVDTLEDVKGSGFSYQNRTWNNTRIDLQKREELYSFDRKTKVMIDDFKEYVTTGAHSEVEIQKALAVTFFKISEHHLFEKPTFQNNSSFIKGRLEFYPQYIGPTMGEVIAKVRTLPGCMGGGKVVTAVESLTPRSATSESFGDNEDKYGSLEFPCPHKECGKINKRTKNQLISNCKHCGQDVRC